MQVPAAEGFQLWAASYDLTLNPLIALEGRVLPMMLGDVASKRIVDVGCGTGRWLTRLAELGAGVVGLDLSAPMLAQAARKSAPPGRLAVADAHFLPVASEAADVALCSFAFGYFQRPEAAMSELARIVRHGGRAVVSDLHPSAIAAGWKRSFRAAGTVCEIEHFGHSVERIRSAAREAGLQLHEERHARFGQPEAGIFRAAGKQEAFDELSSTPAIWIGIWRRT